MKYIQVYALFLMLVFCTSCVGQNNPSPPKEKIKSETKDVSTFPESDEGKFHTKYEYTDANGNSLVIQNSFPKGVLYTASNGKEYAKATFWTRIINETDNPLKLTIDFSGDSYEFPSSVGSSGSNYYKIILRSDIMTTDKEGLYNYGLTDIDSFLTNSIDKPSSLKRTIDPKESGAFYVVILFDKGVAGPIRTGLSINGQNLYYRISRLDSTPAHSLMDEKEINCGSINLKNLLLQK